MSKSYLSSLPPCVEDTLFNVHPSFFFPFHWEFYWQKVLENRDMSSFDKNQACCTQRALDIKESNGELWQRRCEQDASANILKEMISLLSLIMSSNFSERLRSFSSLVLSLHPAAESHSKSPASVISLGFQLHSTCNVKCLLPPVPEVKSCPDHDPSPQAAQRWEEADRCMFSPGCSYYQWEHNQLGLENREGLWWREEARKEGPCCGFHLHFLSD